MDGYIIEMLGISKRYSANNILALKNATLKIRPATVHALIGENGAGKTTLMRILCGDEERDTGVIKLNGHDVNIRSPQVAFSLGIGMVYQHFRLIEDFSVAENIALGIEPTRRFWFVSQSDVNISIQKLSQKSGLSVDPYIRVRDLSIGERQKVEILKLLYRNVNVIVLDEPTSVLVEQEIADLFHLLTELRKQGKTIVFISHKLQEVMQVADDITVLRNGETVWTGQRTDINGDKLVSLMVGGDLDLNIVRSPLRIENNKPKLRVRNICISKSKDSNLLKDVSFDVGAGEILGLAGVAGNGQKPLAEAIFGLQRISSGKVLIGGRDVTFSTPRIHRESGMAYIPNDRMREGCCPTASITDNLISNKYYKLCYHSWLKVREIAELAEKLIDTFAVKAPSISCEVGMLSGGNIQKVILAREVSSNPDVLIAFDPTWGLDIRSTKFVHETLLRMRDQGKAILLISSNLDEVLNLSDRVLVIYAGEIVASFKDTKVITKSKIGEYMLGLRRMQPEQLRGNSVLCVQKA